LRALITGASGFAGAWLCRECATGGDEVVALSRRGTAPDGWGRGVAVDLRDGPAVREAIRAAEPDVVYHLAALTSVGRSWEDPARTLGDNVGSAVQVLEAVRALGDAAPRIIWVGSCEVYGQAPALPASEAAPIRPANPYAVSKAAGEMLAEVYVDAYGLDVIRARPFSHSGPGQLPIYLLSNLSRQAAEGRRAGARALRIVTGNPDTRRDFTDVRDMVRAYRLLATAAPYGDPGAPSGVYNVASGVSVSAADQVALLTELMAPMQIEHVVDPALVRASEVMDLRGDHSRLTALTGWEPQIPLRQTMSDTIAWWERQLND
jgi:GDP-4-dehydro-6-deoxy-D-mannose reductase